MHPSYSAWFGLVWFCSPSFSISVMLSLLFVPWLLLSLDTSMHCECTQMCYFSSLAVHSLILGLFFIICFLPAIIKCNVINNTTKCKTFKNQPKIATTTTTKLCILVFFSSWHLSNSVVHSSFRRFKITNCLVFTSRKINLIERERDKITTTNTIKRRSRKNETKILFSRMNYH